MSDSPQVPNSNRPDSPCIAICSTSQGDDVCKGCGRTFDEVTRWVGMSQQEKSQVWDRIDTQRTAWRYTKYKERAENIRNNSKN